MTIGITNANIYPVTKGYLEGTLTELTKGQLDGITEIRDYAFSDYTTIQSVDIPSTVTTIGEWAFQGTGLTSIVIPSSVTTIGTGAFEDCNALASVTLQEGLTYLSERMFQNCGALTSVTVPSTVTSMRRLSLACNDSLTIYMRPFSPPTVINRVVTSDFAGTIYVPIGRGDVYRNADYWSEYANMIQEASI